MWLTPPNGTPCLGSTASGRQLPTFSFGGSALRRWQQSCLANTPRNRASYSLTNVASSTWRVSTRVRTGSPTTKCTVGRPPLDEASTGRKRTKPSTMRPSGGGGGGGGGARQSSRCRHCLSEHHGIEACPDLPLMPVEFLLVPPLVPAQHPSGQHRGPSVHPAVRSREICRKFNENRCFFPQCRRHSHTCSSCNGPHPALSRPRARRDPYPRLAPLT